MASGFSSVLKIADLDDFINPSQECIKPIQIPRKVENSTKLKIELEDDGTYSQVSEDSKETLKKVEISLTDCLACSGCITSAESVLISEQGPEQMLRQLSLFKDRKDAVSIVSLGMQAILSFANFYSIQPQEAAERLAGYFASLGANYVISLSLAEELCLIESSAEFLEHFKNNQHPVISGICPGWICYAEKVQPHSLPNISKVKSPQQIMGSLLKLVYGPRNGFSPDQILHISLMSCFDRKLESSREDFILQDYKLKEVDFVCTPLELLDTMNETGKTLLDFEPIFLKDLFFNDKVEHTKITCIPGCSTGGYAEHIFKQACQDLYEVNCDEIDWKEGRNPDLHEAILKNESGVQLRFWKATGFRNIQTFVRKIKLKNKNLPHYIELMACPTGCVNGGAQLQKKEIEGTSRSLSKKLKAIYDEVLPSEVKLDYKQFYDALKDQNALFKQVLYTEYHALQQQTLGLSTKW